MPDANENAKADDLLSLAFIVQIFRLSDSAFIIHRHQSSFFVDFYVDLLPISAA